MKIYARQISPEYQESPLFIGDEFFPDNIAVFGNRDYVEHLPEIVQRVREILNNGELADILENVKVWGDWYKNATEAITEYLPPESGKRYSTNAIHALRELTVNFSRCRSCEEDGIFCKVLSIVTGKKWDYSTIRGCCQGDWQEVFYPVDEWDKAALEAFEVQYFNTGSEWIVHDEAESPESPDEINGFSVYCIGWNTDAIKAEIAEAAGGSPEEVVLYQFSGYSRTPIYEEV